MIHTDADFRQAVTELLEAVEKETRYTAGALGRPGERVACVDGPLPLDVVQELRAYVGLPPMDDEHV